jgi:hypothetical protein
MLNADDTRRVLTYPNGRDLGIHLLGFQMLIYGLYVNRQFSAFLYSVYVYQIIFDQFSFLSSKLNAQCSGDIAVLSN